MLDFPSDVKAVWQPASVNCAVMSSANIGIYAFCSSVIFAIMRTSGIKGKIVLLGYVIISKLLVPLYGAHAANSWGMVRICTSSSRRVLFLPLVFRRNGASPTWCFILVRWMMWISVSNSLKLHRASLPVALAMARNHQNASRYVQIVKQDPFKHGHKSVMPHTAGRLSLWILANFSSFSLSSQNQ